MSATAATAPSHRDRLLAAMAQSVEDKGFRETFVGDVVAIAHTSRRTFYEHFADREACYLALFEWAQDEVLDSVAAAAAPDRPWERQVDDALAAWLDTLAQRPKLWWSFTRELPALGQAGAERQHAGMLRFAELLVTLVEAGRRSQPQLGAKPLTLDEAIIIVGGLRELVVSASEQGRDVRELRPLAARTVNAILGATVLA